MATRAHQKPSIHNSSLFDDKGGWGADPMEAFLELIQSAKYANSNRSSAPLPKDHTVRRNSARVYQAMFGRYLRFLSDLEKSFVEATDQDVARFLDGALAEASKETRSRYVRLIERAYARAFEVGAVTGNPASDYARQGKLAGKSRFVPDAVSAEVLADLQRWLNGVTAEHLHGASRSSSSWRTARDAAMASLCLASGLRLAEVTALRLDQIVGQQAAGSSDLELNIPQWATVQTAMAHKAVAEPAPVGAFEVWWRWRTTDMPHHLKNNKSRIVFPAGLQGEPMEASTVYRAFKSLAAAAIEDKALLERDAWILTTGATGLRRAFIVSSLARGKDPDVLTAWLGHHQRRSIRRYKTASPRPIAVDTDPVKRQLRMDI